MKDERRAKFVQRLHRGGMRTISPTTHPFAFADDIETCARCGVSVRLNDDTLYSLVAYIQDPEADTTTIQPLVIIECSDCMAIPLRDRDLHAEFAPA